MAELLERRKGGDLYLTIMMLAKFSLMPELLEFFDWDTKRFLRFIDLFGGCVISVPERDEVGRMARNVHILRALERSDGHAPTIRRQLAELYDLSEVRVKKIYEATRKEMEDGCRRAGSRDPA